ncbi:hypothetical protein LTR62_000151 [Meristemomyces frigidus]|uniref:DUF1308 domain-containing protein n=1 Tax=Meristemomyces frigidus TaxID=1508187 RepID=A0AAN7TK45_9PEZI|nr:hypothetical protein LTR62_000151 [Meristemomyces frigidus]
MEKADEEPSEKPGPSVIDLVQRAQVLLAELQVFRDRLRHLRQEGNVELSHFRGTVQSELAMLERLLEKPNDTATTHVARSSNLPFLETLWRTVKPSRNLVSLQKRIYTVPGTKQQSQGLRHVRCNGQVTKGKGAKDGAVVVDAITDGGRTWTKVSLITNSRLLFDLAKQGWDSGGSDFDDDEEGQPPSYQVDDLDRDVPLVKTAKELCYAATCFRVRSKRPTVHMVLPRVRYGETSEVDSILDACKAAGVTLHCGTINSVPNPAPSIEDAVQNMAPDPLDSFSNILNIDCTILLALVSEFSHAKVSKQPWFHTALRRQVEIEDNENLLPSLLYPAMGNHELVSTREAVDRMRDIVSTIGTPSEKARTAILLGDDTTLDRAGLTAEMQAWSAYPVPNDWQLPILTIDAHPASNRNSNSNSNDSRLPPQAEVIAANLTTINRSVFLSGWAAGRTTITSNRTVVKQIETELEALSEGELDEEKWPRIWLCPTARSLVGKEKRGVAGRKAELEGKEEGDGKAKGSGKVKGKGKAWPMPDPLRREQQRRNGLDVLGLRAGHEVEDLRPNGYPCEEVLAAKAASLR